MLSDCRNLSEKDNPECSITKICVPDKLGNFWRMLTSSKSVEHALV